MAIPPVTRIALGHGTWVTVLCRKLRDWWHWVAEGDMPIVIAQGAEVEAYNALDPGVRVVILKALCDIHVEIKEKEIVYKRYREETKAAKMMEEEKALKQLRRTLVPHARHVPNFDHPFLPQKSAKEIMKAKSPKLRVDRRKEKCRIVCQTPTAAAFHMR